MVDRAEKYRWSSARAHAYGKSDPFVDPGSPLVGAIGSWADWLAAEDIPTELEAIRKATARDLPLASEEFITELEFKLGRTLRPKKRGRKPRGKAEPEQQIKLAFEE
jgi:putative transposase